MSRKNSVVLSPAETKAALKEAKQVLKDAQATAKTLVAEAKTVAKARAAEDKDFTKREAVAVKAVALAQGKVDALTAA